MTEQEDQFYVEPEEEHVREVHQLQLPPSHYDKPISPEDSKNLQLKMVEVPREIPYQYKRFKFDKQPQSDQQPQEESFQQEFESPFTEFYSNAQMVYKKYNNRAIAEFKNCYYFAGSFLHKNVFTSIDFMENDSFVEMVQGFYDVNLEKLPQQNIDPEELRFDSHFESGNLFAAFKYHLDLSEISHCEYDLVMEMDTNSRGNNQWFYFSVQNMVMGKEYTFNVVNFTKNDSLFNYGMEPAVYSTKQALKYKDEEKSWKRMGLEVLYKKGPIPREKSKRFYYKLSFKLIAKYAGDKLFIAHSYPYTYSKLLQYIENKLNNHKGLVERIQIGKTLSNRPLEVLKIALNNSKKKESKKAIIIMARQHPGQTQGSYVCQGVIEKLLAKTKEGEFLRKNYVFYVIPMVNIDGVFYGHYRTNLAGKDLNRKWDSTQKENSCPEVTSVKNFLSQLSKQRSIRFVLDLHGHSKKLNSFFYGNPCAQNPQVVRIYPLVCSKLTPAIQFYDCTFSTQEYKRRAARVYLSFLYKLLHVYTFQSSFYAYFKDGKKIEFTPHQYRQLGGSLISGLFMQLQHEIKYQQSFQFNLNKTGMGKQYFSSPFVRILNELKQSKHLMELGNQCTSGSDSRPEEGQINQQLIQQTVKKQPKLSRPPSLILQQEPKSLRISRKGQRQVRQVIKPIRNIRFLEISKINSVLPDKYQLCLQPIKTQAPRLSNTMKTSISTVMKINSEAQTQKDKEQQKYKQYKKNQIQTCPNLSSSTRVEQKTYHSSNEKRYSSVIRTQNRNNIIFKIDFNNHQETRQEKIAHIKKIAKNVNLKHSYSQTIISFSYERKKEKQKLSQQFLKEERLKHSQTFLPSMNSPDKEDKRWARNNNIKYDTVRVGNKREAELFLNGVVKRYLVEKQQPKQQPLSIFSKALQRPKSFRKKEVTRR